MIGRLLSCALLLFAACRAQESPVRDVPVATDNPPDGADECRPATSPTCTFESEPFDCSSAFYLNHPVIEGDTARAKCHAVCNGAAALDGEYGLNGTWCDQSCYACISVIGMTCEACCLLSDAKPPTDLCPSTGPDSLGDIMESPDADLLIDDRDSGETECANCGGSTPFPSPDCKSCWECWNNTNCDPRSDKWWCDPDDHTCKNVSIDNPPCGWRPCPDGQHAECCDDSDCANCSLSTGKCIAGRCELVPSDPCSGQCGDPFPVCAILNNVAQCVKCLADEHCVGIDSACKCSGAPTYTCVLPDGTECSASS